MNSGTLFIVATPIGNLEDLTFRSLRILGEVEVVVCEDQRVTKKLLTHYNLSTRTLSIHHHSSPQALAKIVRLLEEGKNLAYVCDAGTPGVSDPGNHLVARAIEKGITVTPIPGASALSSIISISGINMSRFRFLGFVPHKKGRETFFREVGESEDPVIYFDSPHRIEKNLALLGKFAPQKHLIIGRELTKMFEQVVRGAVDNFSEVLGKCEKIKGEFVVIVYESSLSEKTK